MTSIQIMTGTSIRADYKMQMHRINDSAPMAVLLSALTQVCVFFNSN